MQRINLKDEAKSAKNIRELNQEIRHELNKVAHKFKFNSVEQKDFDRDCEVFCPIIGEDGKGAERVRVSPWRMTRES